MQTGTEQDGQWIAKVLANYARDEVFVTTKIWRSDHGYEKVIEAARQSLRRLNIDHVDLLLLHWPGPKVSKNRFASLRLGETDCAKHVEFEMSDTDQSCR